MFGIGAEEDDHRIELGVVEFIHGAGRDIQEGVASFIHQIADGAESDDPWTAATATTSRSRSGAASGWAFRIQSASVDF